jgi:hypothetical protein
MVHFLGQGICIGSSLPKEVVYLEGSDDAQSSIESREDVDESGEKDELSADQIQTSRKVNSIATIEALCLKPSSLSHMPIPLCRR